MCAHFDTSCNQPLPGQWKNTSQPAITSQSWHGFFVKNGKAKFVMELFNKCLFATARSMCYCLSSTDGKAVTVNEVDGLCGCSHEEADTQLLLHAVYAADNAYSLPACFVHYTAVLAFTFVLERSKVPGLFHFIL